MAEQDGTLTDQLIRFAAVTPPASVTQMMRLSLLDWAACGIAGARDPSFARFKEQHQGGDGAVLFGGGSAAPSQAALVNGTLSHALDYDDTHFAHIGHPSVAVLPAALAVAQDRGVSFDALAWCDCRTRWASALAGQRRGSFVATWPTDSPLTVFFWSEKVRPAHVMRDKVFSSFKGAVRAG